MALGISNELFEQKSKDNYDNLKKSFLNTINQIRWNKNKATQDIVNYFLDEIAALPNDPFSENLISLLEWEYGTLANDINEILNQIDSIRQKLLPKERRILFENKYYNFHLVTRNKHIKEQVILDADGDICYITHYRLKIKLKYLFLSKIAKTKEEKESMERLFLGLQPEVVQKKELYIYYYSPIINIHTTDINKYFEFYVDYYSKKLFRNFITEFFEKEKPLVEVAHVVNQSNYDEFNKPVEFDVSRFSNAQIVLLTYFYLKEFGLEPRVGTYVTTMVRFIHIITQTNYTKAKNSAYYKMAMKAPNFKSDPKLLKDLEIIMEEFKRVELPTDEIEKEIHQAKRNFSA